MADALHVKQLIDRAHALGADRAAPLAAAAVVVDERVRLKCRVPLLLELRAQPDVPAERARRRTRRATRWPATGGCWSCSRTSPSRRPRSPRRCRTATRRRGALADTPEPEARAAGESRAVAAAASLAAPAAGCEARVTAAQNAFASLMSSLETEAFKLGCRFAAAYSGGDCVLCDVCVGQGSGEPCRHPFAARPVHGGGRHRRRRHGRGGRPDDRAAGHRPSLLDRPSARRLTALTVCRPGRLSH